MACLTGVGAATPLASLLKDAPGTRAATDDPVPRGTPEKTPPAQPPATPPAAPSTAPPAATPPARPANAPPSVQSPTQPVAPDVPPLPAQRLPPDTELKRENFPPPPMVNGKKKRVYIIEDRFNECGGTVEAETDDYIVIETKGKLRGFYKSRVAEIVTLLDPPKDQPGVVIMRDGMEYHGIILADEVDFVQVQVEGIKQMLPRANVLRTVLTLTPRQTYEKARAEIKPDQYSDRFKLCRYLFEHKMYPECREELVALLEAVELYEAKELLRTVDAQLALETKPTKSADGDPLTEDTPDDTTPIDQHERRPTRILSPEDVNIIRVYEIDFRKPPKVVVAPAVIKEMIEKYAASDLIPTSAEGRTALYREDPAKIVRLMFDLRARELYPKIDVLTEPASLNQFRRRVHNTWLINNCATSQCHGGVDAGRLFLHGRNAQSTQVRYTNLLLLERTKIPGRPPLIDWEKPRDSLILQFGLPRSEARYPHPDVKGWRPAFNPANRRLVDDFIRWVEMMYEPRPEYPVELTPPDLTAPDRPSPADAPVIPR